MDIELIRNLASAFRIAVQRTVKESLPTTMERFPSGACGDASLLLSKYLQENGCGQFKYVLGERGDSSHAWLRQDGLVVDITGDQFSDGPGNVYVGPVTSWHAAFAGESQHVADFEIYDERTKSVLRWAYANIMATIERQTSEPNNAM